MQYRRVFRPQILLIACVLAACGGGSSGDGGGDALLGKQAEYSVGGTLSFTGTGAAQGAFPVVLENRRSGATASLTAVGTFVFGRFISGTAYEIHVPRNPTGYSCDVRNGNGQIGSANKNDIEVVCTPGAFAVRGVIGGLGASNPGLQLRNGADVQSIGADGPFSFSVINREDYEIRIATPHSVYTCQLRNSLGNAVMEVTGTIDAADVQGLTVTCELPINVTVSGLGSSAATLRASNTYSNPPGGDSVENLSIAQNGTFRFDTALPFGRSYRIDVIQQPVGFTCVPNSPSGSTGLSAVDVTIVCTERRYSIGGAVSGLAPAMSVRLVDRTGGSTETIDSNRSFTIGAAQVSGTNFDIAVDAQPAKARCTVTNGAGTVEQTDVTNVAVACRQLLAYLYSANATGSSISQFLVESGTGNVVANQTPQLQVSATPTKLVTHPSNRFAYAVVSGSIAVFGMNPDNGLLSTTNLSVSVPSPRDIGFDAVGSNAYVVGTNLFQVSGTFFAAHQLSHYRVDSFSDGNLLLQQRTAVGPTIGGIIILPRLFGIGVAPAGNFAYIGTGDSIWHYTFNGSGVPSAVNSVSGTGTAFTLHPNGRFAYFVSAADRTVRQFNVAADGALTAIGATSPSTGINPTAIAVEHSGRFAYVVNRDDNTVSRYAIDANGVLTLQLPAIATGLQPSSMAIDSSNAYAYVSNFGSDSIWQYALGVNGELNRTALSALPTGAGPSFITLATVR